MRTRHSLATFAAVLALLLGLSSPAAHAEDRPTPEPSSTPSALLLESIERGAANQFLFVTPASPQPLERGGFSVEYTPSYSLPADGPITSRYGTRECPETDAAPGCTETHNGVDFGGGGRAIVSVAEGTVVVAGYADDGYGNRVIVEHQINGHTVRTLYAHMRDRTIDVRVGETVKRGQQLGVTGATGRAVGEHLHFEVTVDGVRINPLPWLDALDAAWRPLATE